MLKNLLASAGDTGSIPDPGRSPGRGNGNSLQYSCLGKKVFLPPLPWAEEPGRLQSTGSHKSQTGLRN